MRSLYRDPTPRQASAVMRERARVLEYILLNPAADVRSISAALGFGLRGRSLVMEHLMALVISGRLKPSGGDAHE